MDAALWTLACVFVVVIAAATTQALRFQNGLQNTINLLRSRLDAAEGDIRACLEDRAALRQRLEDLEKKAG